ncbi:CHASE2 domain-containing protein, partial [bacterium]|nr:CHASE2 domain-containing protein [bacterium]
IIAIFTLGGIAPPPALKDLPDRISFNDNFLVDVSVDPTVPKVRRSHLFSALTNGEPVDAFPFRLATLYLSKRGIETEPDPGNPAGFKLGKASFRPFKPNDGAYVRADASGFQMLLDFKCPEYFRRFTLNQALENKIPPGTLKDKIVLLGINTASETNTASVLDEKVTPIRRDHAGVEVQALTVHQILRYALDGEKPLRFWPDWAEDSWILLWCLLGGATGYWIRSPWTLVTANTLLLLSGGLAAWMFFQSGLWIPLVAPLLSFLPASGLVVSYISFNEKRQRGHLMQLFSKQVSPDIAKALWEQREDFLAGHRPKPQRLTATVLFTDLVGFTAISEKLDPAQLMDWLNEYMEAMANTIMAHQGVVEKYIGDAIMAVFGAPLPRNTEAEVAEDARNAVHCALAMSAKLEELNALWTARGLRRAGMRVGIHTGPLVAGSLGSSDRQEYTVLGDTVNTASRLESFKADFELPESAKNCRVLISEATQRLIGDGFEATGVGAISLKNKKDPVTVFLVLPGKDSSGNMPMKTELTRNAVAVGLLAGLLALPATWAQDAGQAKPAAGGSLKFRPQTTSAAGSVRVTGGSRGTGDKTITL